MIDTAQAVLLLVVVILTVLLVILGINVLIILRELKKTVEKANKVLDDTSIITETVSRPVSSLSNLGGGAQMGVLVVKLLQKILKKSKDDGKAS